MHEMPEPEAWDEKEVFTFYGLAAYHSQVLERGLVNLIGVARVEVEAKTRDDVDDIVTKLERLTLGRLLKSLPDSLTISDDVIKLLEEALAKRNWLAHNYFYDRAVAFASEGGCVEMIQELRSLATLFHQADAAIQPIIMPILRRVNVTDERLEELTKELMGEYKA